MMVPWQRIAWALMTYRRWQAGEMMRRARAAEWYGLAHLTAFEAFMATEKR